MSDPHLRFLLEVLSYNHLRNPHLDDALFAYELWCQITDMPDDTPLDTALLCLEGNVPRVVELSLCFFTESVPNREDEIAFIGERVRTLFA